MCNTQNAAGTPANGTPAAGATANPGCTKCQGKGLGNCGAKKLARDIAREQAAKGDVPEPVDADNQPPADAQVADAPVTPTPEAPADEKTGA
jgi:hypothetical protein